jgi:hypothetical protein
MWRRVKRLSELQWIVIGVGVAIAVAAAGYSGRGDESREICDAARELVQRAGSGFEYAEQVCAVDWSEVREEAERRAVSSPGCHEVRSGEPVSRAPVERPRTPVPYFAARAGAVPADGTPMVAGIELPRGSRCSRHWASDEVVANAPELARRLAAAFPRTGLWPVLWTERDDPDAYIFPDERPTAVDAIRVETVLRREWDAVGLGPAAFPGLAPALGADAPARFPSVDRPAVLLLVPANRPADVIAALGSPDSEYISSLEATAIARSWEERFGAAVSTLALGTVGFAVGAPPRTDGQARALAVEWLALQPAAAIPEYPDGLEYLAPPLRSDAWEFQLPYD